ncbi:MAG: acetoacetyl-CoA synthetase [Alphaproteobacteria bacterium]|nr:acetoacetyl-CoA synthetase [Alphaproteobacteria bacterium]
MTTILWRPSPKHVQEANITRFMKKIREDYGLPILRYDDLYTFSIDHPEKFWKAVWSFCGVIAERQGDQFLVGAETIETAKFFPDARLNFAENLLRRRDEAIAVTFYGEDRVFQKLTFQDLYQQTAKLADTFKKWGVQPGDRVAGYLPNMPQAIIAMLATASIGAVWSSCSPDFGVQGVVDRFSQITPKVFLMADGYFYGGKTFSCLERLSEIQASILSIEKVIIVPYTLPSKEINFKAGNDPVEIWANLMAVSSAQSLEFAQLPFDHPLFILYSSGTTGVPKCIVHSAGGTLLQHLKEHQLHCDIKPSDQVFYYTTCGWMMWNWLVSALASRASLVLYEGSPVYPHPETLFDMADKEGITLFGTSAKFIDMLAKVGANPMQTHSLSSLRMMTSTGSPLVPESFDYVYQSIKKDVCLASISGGTDIISCFVLGNPVAPVWRGEVQSRGLGLAVAVYNEAGRPVVGEKGELVCTKPFPSQPLGFWNDPTGEKYHAAYFGRFPNVWHHGDFVELTPQGGMVIYGRSDTVLNPAGVRIGTSEIYRQVEKIPEILESLAIGQKWHQDERVILFVQLKEGIFLSEGLINKIKAQIRQNTTPRHVPAKIIAVGDIPKTKNGKIAERAVRDLIHGEPMKSQDTLANPEALEQFKGLSELAEEVT